MGPKCSYVEPPIDVEREPAETAKMALYAIGSWFSMLGATMIELMRKHGLRINLRMLASKKVMMVLFVCALFSILKKVFGLFYRV
uniref:Uncharacterized protein n=1 Tax=Rhizophora mucronata TaxID=61149 RepID=A0A2P2QDW7_RHIMU